MIKLNSIKWIILVLVSVPIYVSAAAAVVCSTLQTGCFAKAILLLQLLPLIMLLMLLKQTAWFLSV
jgi:hypothetical protein